MVTADPFQWESVAHAVRVRRTELDMMAVDVVDQAGRGLSLANLSQIENARKDSYSVRTIAALCRGLRWTPDSIDRILAGKDPVVAQDEADETAADRLERLERRVAELERDRDDQPLTFEQGLARLKELEGMDILPEAKERIRELIRDLREHYREADPPADAVGA